MDPKHVQERLESFERSCHARGIPVTIQRRGTLEAALSLGTHPTADEVHAVLSARLPAVSRTTVYRTLETLDRLGVIRKVCHPGGSIRYDMRTERHHHLVCLRCGGITDFSNARLDGLRVSPPEGSGFEVTGFQVTLSGSCRHCRQQEGRS